MIQNTAVYTDFNGLRELEAGAKERSPEATREAAKQFEALFLQMMLKSMREANAVLAEERDTTYEEMFDDQIAMELSSGKGIGIADLLMRQLGGADGRTEPPTLNQGLLQHRITPGRESAGNIAEVAGSMNLPGRDDFRPENPENFLEEIWPMAEQAGEKLGVDPRAVAAQAALETGWGQHQIRDTRGVSGNNLFGIKADQRWDGDRVNVPTLEYESGVPKRQNALFRAYQNLQEGFNDYVEFLQGNPRYGEALQAGRDALDYAASLQRAGYATDPRYADKIRNIMESPRFTRVIDGLKAGSKLPTS